MGVTFASTDHIELARGEVDLTGAWTLLLAVKPTAGERVVLHNVDRTFGVYWVRNGSSQQIVLQVGASSASGSLSSSPQLNRWSLLLITKAAGSARPRFHLGVQHSDGSNTLGSLSTTSRWKLSGYSGLPYLGSVGGIAWWNRALTDEECRNIYNGAHAVDTGAVNAVALNGSAPYSDLVGSMDQTAISGTSSDGEEPMPGFYTDPATVEFRGFESNDGREWWMIQKPAVQTTPVPDSSVVKWGAVSARFELNRGETYAGDGTHRNEVAGPHLWYAGQERWFAWSTRLDRTIAVESGKWAVISQWRDAKIADGSNPYPPSVELLLTHDAFDANGKLQLRSYGTGGAARGSPFVLWETSARRDVFHNFVVRIMFSDDIRVGWIELMHSTGSDALVQQRLSPSGTTREPACTLDSASYTYFKQGIYRDSTYASSWKLWHDALVISRNP